MARPRMSLRPRERQAAHEVRLAQVLALLPTQREHLPTIREWCRAAGVSERTLRTTFVATLGMSPVRYLRLRRLHLLRAALAIAGQRHTSVASIAAGFGFTDYGRMAADYRALFGENPSATLLRGINGD